MKKNIAILFVVFLIVPFYSRAQDPLWSILIYTNKNNKESFARLYQKLQSQIERINAQEEIEIVYFIDDGKYTNGFKKNSLLAESTGKYINYINETIDISDKFIQMIYQKLIKSPDCVSVISIFNRNMDDFKMVISSIKYNQDMLKEGVSYRPLNELNPIKRSIALPFSFSAKNDEENFFWPKKLSQSKMVEMEIEEPCYFFEGSKEF